MPDSRHDDDPPNLPASGKLPASRDAGVPSAPAVNSDPAHTGDNQAAARQGKSNLPEAPQRDKRPSKKPVVIKRPPMVVSPEPVAFPRLEQEPPGGDKKESKSLSRSEDETRRLFTAAGIGSRQGVARVSWSDQLVFRCPVCAQQLQCSDVFIGKSFECTSCYAELGIPLPESGEKIELIRSGGLRTGKPDLPAVDLPDGRGDDGPAGKTSFQAIDELLPDDEDATHGWGLENPAVLSGAPRRSRLWVLFAAGMLLSSIGFLVFQTTRTSGRSTAPAGGNDLEMAATAMHWSTMTPIARYMQADKIIRAYLQAPDIPTKAQFSRGNPKVLERMTAYYARAAGYEPETKTHGAVRSVVLGEHRTIGKANFQMVKVDFANGSSGVYALAAGANGYEVDWDYAVGFGEMAMADLLAAKPLQPVLMRVYLEEGVFFVDGFPRELFRQFDMTDSGSEHYASVFVARSSPVEAAIREAYREEVVRALSLTGTQGAKKLDFTVRLRYENAVGSGGFVIDEVLGRGWILPD